LRTGREWRILIYQKRALCKNVRGLEKANVGLADVLIAQNRFEGAYRSRN